MRLFAQLKRIQKSHHPFGLTPEVSFRIQFTVTVRSVDESVMGIETLTIYRFRYLYRDFGGFLLQDGVPQNVRRTA